MKTFLRENPTIAFGLGLPLLLVVVFLLVSGIPSLLVAPPQHDVIYATNYYNHQNGVQISVVNNKVQLVSQGSTQNIQKPRIWRYSPVTGAVKEISYILPQRMNIDQSNNADATNITSTVIPVAELNNIKVDTSSIAPDGYEFSLGQDRYSGNVFDGLFYSSRYRHQAVLTKNGRSLRLPNAAGRYYRSNTHFIGWVISP